MASFSTPDEESSGNGKMMKPLNPYLPVEIWSKIFLRCPLKRISMLKCSSKVWKSQLSSRSFVYQWMQNNCSAGHPWILLYNHKSVCKHGYLDSSSRLITKHNEYPIGFPNPDKETVMPLCSSKGLVLCSNRKNLAHHYHICNPLTQKWVSLPVPKGAQLVSVIGFICEVLELSTTFKVVRILRPFNESTNCHLQVFVSGSKRWDEYSFSSSQGLSWTFRNRNAVIRGEMVYCMDVENRILAFSKTDVYELHLPDNSNDEGNLVRCFGECEGIILYARIKKRKRTLSIWEFKEERFDVLQKNIGIHGLIKRINNKLSGMSGEESDYEESGEELRNEGSGEESDYEESGEELRNEGSGEESGEESDYEELDDEESGEESDYEELDDEGSGEESDNIELDNDWDGLVQFSFSPTDRNVIMIKCRNYRLMYNIETETCDELYEPSSCPALVLKAMPTTVPLPSSEAL